MKRTALGRLKHEGATVHVAKGGRVVVYMGDDQDNEYVYKFVSADNWQSCAPRGRSPLDEGTLYVGRVQRRRHRRVVAAGPRAGRLTAANGFADQGDVLVRTRQAADAVGATPMDRPEWIAVRPAHRHVYLTLTNNTSRATATAPPTPASPTRGGTSSAGASAAATTPPPASSGTCSCSPARAGRAPTGRRSPAEDTFGSPDGLWLDPDGRVWIQTDGTQPDGANNQMLAADPYRTDAAGAPEVRRFLTGVVGCEVTGIAMTPDQRTLFINIQHPGEAGGSTWPQRRTASPRPAPRPSSSPRTTAASSAPDGR